MWSEIIFLSVPGYCMAPFFIWTHMSMKLCLVYTEWQGPVYLSEPLEWPWVFAYILGSALPTWLLFHLLTQWQVLTPT